MNREIKFRAWDGEKMHHSNLLALHEGFTWDHGRKYLHDSTQWENEDGFCWSPALMQYTGLKDKNGKDIYEGDIINSKRGNGYDFDADYAFAVKFDNGAFRSDNTDVLLWDYIRPKRITELTNYEVIGNIYENPELLAL